MDQPLVSVIIATRNRVHVLQRCLNEYCKQTYTNLELIVVDNGSTDETWSMLSQREDVVAIRLDENMKAEALNIAIRASKCRYVWRTDDDAYPADPFTIAAAVDHLEAHPQAAVVSGLAININDGHSVVGRHIREHELQSPDGYLEHSSFIGCTALLRRSAVIKAGGFWQEFYNEEQDLSLRLLRSGWKIHWKPTLVTHHLAEFVLSSQNLHARRWQTRVTTRTRLLATYLPTAESFIRMTLELHIECAAAVYKGLSIGIIMETIRLSFTQWRLTSGNRLTILPPDVRRFAIQHTMGMGETIRYYMFRARVRVSERASI